MRAKRIQMYVSGEFKKIAILIDEERFEPALEEMA